MNKTYLKFIQLFIMLSFLTLTLVSCIGMSLDIQMNRDGSGRLTMEYRISRLLDNLGRLDGNESMPTIPVGRTDWERTVQRIPGLKLVSYSSKEETQDTVIKVVLDYDNEKTLISLFDPSGDRASISRQGQNGNLSLTVLDDSAIDKNIKDLIRVFSNDYNFSLSFSGPGNSSLLLTDGSGNPLPAPQNAKIVQIGRRVSFSIGINDILDIENGLGFKLNW